MTLALGNSERMVDMGTLGEYPAVSFAYAANDE